MNISGKTALITGGSAGIGQAVAFALAEAGASAVLIADIDDAGGEETVTGIESRGARGIYRHTDVTDSSDMKGLFEAAEREMGGIDIVHNNAGIMLGDPGWPDVALERIGQVVQVNLIGIMFGTRLAIDALTRRGGGTVINTASPAGFNPMPNDPMYSSTKAAIINFTQACMPLNETHKVRVNTVLPGVTETAILRKSGDGVTPAEWLRPMLAVVNKLSVEDISKGVIDLIEDDSRVGEGLSIENPETSDGEISYVRLADHAAFHERALARAAGR